MKKDQVWTWTKEHQKAFNLLKTCVTSKPILAHPELDKQFELKVDALRFAVEAVLLQRKEVNKRHPVGYYSATLNAAKRNYDIYDLEPLAIIKALRHWRPPLAGSLHKIKVFSDHMNLKYWQDPQKISQCMAREVLELSEYDLEIHHIKGTLNGHADALSRTPDYDQGEDDNKDIVVLPDHLFVRMSHLEWIEEEEPKRLFQVEDMTKKHPIYEQEEATLKSWVDPHHLKKIYDTWYKDGRRVVTNKLEHQRSLIQSHHDPLVYEHPGINRTICLLERYYCWPGLQKEVTDYVKGCVECQRHKVNKCPTQAALSPIYPTPEALHFKTIALDFITKLPESQGFNSILTITDHDCTKMLHFIPCREEINAEETAALYAKYIFPSYGLPSKIISDRDPRFAPQFTCQVLDGTWVHDVCKGSSVGCKVCQWKSLWVYEALAKSKRQWSMEEQKGFWGLSQEVNEYRTREYHYN